MATREDFARFLRGIMADHGYTSNVDLARLLDVEPATISRWLAATGEPSIDNLRHAAPNLRMLLVDLMVEAGVISEAEAGHKPLPARPLPREIRLTLELLDKLEKENVPERYPKALLQGVGHARTYFLELFVAPQDVIPTRRKTEARRGSTQK